MRITKVVSIPEIPNHSDRTSPKDLERGNKDKKTMIVFDKVLKRAAIMLQQALHQVGSLPRPRFFVAALQAL